MAAIRPAIRITSPRAPTWSGGVSTKMSAALAEFRHALIRPERTPNATSIPELSDGSLRVNLRGVEQWNA